ncbi:hypothetical protein FZ983_27415 [Azospirillum sp. B21]|uniref:hypothetical protein n=1 Tax=Azospirillum sp. B21 TaxID=2607496 RepID=UPI0011EC3D04|nr:hypothetical protein [Azospirillum sp. B21]KAA0574631.1 hypothetical protein FZ983_27415 [Azospirillum sp. B21]
MTLDEYLALRTAVSAAGYEREIEWAQNLAPPTCPVAFALELGWVILNSGMRYRVAYDLWHGVEAKARLGISALLQAGRSAGEEFRHVGKVAALDRIWSERETLLVEFLAIAGDEQRIEWLGCLPWIGPITRYHAAKNLGVDTVKPDRHMARLAGRPDWETARIEDLYPAVVTLCRPLANASGDRLATVDMVLWRAAELGIINTRSSLSGARTAICVRA